jgi:hypothetical protein
MFKRGECAMGERVVRTGLSGVSVEGLVGSPPWLPVLEVVVMTPGPANGWVFTAEGLRNSVARFEGATVFCNHTDALDRTRAGERRVEDLVGVLSGLRWQPDYIALETVQRAAQAVGSEYNPLTTANFPGKGALLGTLTASGPKGPLVAELARAVIEDRAAGLPTPNVGLSADVLVELAGDGKTVTAIRRVFSVDVVFSPARGGRFERILNAVGVNSPSSQPSPSREKGINPYGGERGEQVGDGVESTVDGGAAGGRGSDGHGVGAAESAARTAARGGTAGAGADSGGVATAQRAVLAEIEAARVQAEKLAQEQIRVACANLLTTALQASSLPDALKGELREQFAQRIFTADELTAAIAKKDQVYAKLLEGQVIRGMGLHGPVIHGMRDSLDRVQAAANLLLGAPVPENLRDTPRLSGLRELYVMLTGDYDFHGQFHGERVQLANVTTSTVTSVVKNAMNVVMLEYFNQNPKWWAPIAHEEDFATMDQITWLTTGGFADLATVAEGDPYVELNWSDNEETSSFVKKGNYIGITLEMIDRDRVAAVKAIPRKLGIAAYRTVSTLVAALFTSNAGVGPTLSDTKALFHADHGNLGTAALDASAWDGVVQAMFKQAEATSTKRLGIRPAHILVPIELEKTALTLFTSPQAPGTANNDVNVRQLPGDRVITVPEWTDANDWAAAADPVQAQGVCIGYRFGRAPELFVADDALTGSMFTNDEMRIKARFVVAVGIGDYRALYKQNVA